MTIRELYEEAEAVYLESFEIGEETHVVASVALICWIELIIERGKIGWGDDSFELRKVNRYLRDHPEQGAKFTQQLERRVEMKGRERK